MLNYKTSHFLGLILITLISCSTFAQQNEQNKSSTEVQVIQTKTFLKPYKQVFRTVVAVLQDNKYKIKFTDALGGVISAEGTPALAENMPGAVALIPIIGGFLSMGRQVSAEKWTVSATVEDLDEESKNKESPLGTLVRIVITSESVSRGMFSQDIKNDDLTDRPEVYQQLFTKIEKALFIRDNAR